MGRRVSPMTKAATSSRRPPTPSAAMVDYDAAVERSYALGSSGWLFIYYVGVIKTLRELGLHKYAPRAPAVTDFARPYVSSYEHLRVALCRALWCRLKLCVTHPCV